MFEECTTLLDLNKSRIDLVRSNPDKLMEINSQYQARRKQIVSAQPAYTRLKPMRPNIEDNPLIMAIPYAGAGTESLTLRYTQKGFTC